MTELSKGWNWVSVDWLYGWMVKFQPINKDCVRLNGKNGECLDCPAAYRRGDMILWMVDGLKRALVSEKAVFQLELKKFEKELGFERLRDYARQYPAEKVTVLSDGSNVDDEEVAPFQPLDALIGVDRIRVVVENRRPYITDGRHRICAAYQFGIADLPVWVEV